MLTLPPSVRIRLAVGPTDMRKQIDGLAAVASQVLGDDPMSGHVFVFCNRRKDYVKLLFWDRSGFWCLAKRLERGTFAWPDRSDQPGVEATVRELFCVLEGIDLCKASRRRRMDRVAVASS